MIVYIGEGSGGCTGDDAFHEELKYVNDEAFEELNNAATTSGVATTTISRSSSSKKKNSSSN